ncbi:MAG: flavodoxin domain-containing protein [Verrucomicrobiota bacterium]
MSKPILILYGSVTGNSEHCADKAADAARARGYDVTIEDMARTSPQVLRDFTTALIITSTYGDGDPPDGTEDFHRGVVQEKNMLLTHLRFCVLALGDRNYDQFCKTGKDYDETLELLGATRFHPRTDCDWDFDDASDAWVEGVFTALAEDRMLLAA